jgi:hypothetical protein
MANPAPLALVSQAGGQRLRQPESEIDRLEQR